MGLLLVPSIATPLPAFAATPATVTVSDTAPGPVIWTSDAFPGGANVTNTQGDNCFDATGHPNTRTPSGPTACEVFTLQVNLSATYWSAQTGGVKLDFTVGATNDFDYYIFRKNADGTKGAFVTSAATGSVGQDEHAVIDKAQGAYYVAVAAYTTTSTYDGSVQVFLGPTIPNAPPTVAGGLTNYRASHDIFTSHSEPHIAMNPLNHANLVAGSKMYVNNKHYLFRIGMYYSFDGGQTWGDTGHLPIPGVAEITPAKCAGDDTSKLPKECLYTTSDVWISFDDEGNAYVIVLVSPSSNQGTGWEMWMYKSTDGGRTWPVANQRVIHDHFNKTLSSLFLDDKDAIAVDNYTQAGTGMATGPNKPQDGKIGNIYACWGLDGTVAPTQNQVVSRSTDGGDTWGTVGLPEIVSGLKAREIGCQLGVAPSGRVYLSFLNYALDVRSGISGVGQYLTWSDDHGLTFAVPIKVADVNQVPNHLQPADNFRNLSLPAMGVSPVDGSVYITWADEHKQGTGKCGDKDVVCDADILLAKCTEATVPICGSPKRVNQDTVGNGKDQFQPQIAITPSGQVNISYFDRRSDPDNFFIDTYLSRSNDGGGTWTDLRVTQKMSDPRINPPIDGGGNFFYGDYQGLVADNTCAIPFWNGTHLANLPATDPNYSPWQEVFSARVSNGGQACPVAAAPPAEAPPAAAGPSQLPFSAGPDRGFPMLAASAILVGLLLVIAAAAGRRRWRRTRQSRT
jgi:hypothetical protein